MKNDQCCENCHFASEDVSVENDEYKMFFCQRFPPSIRDEKERWHQPLVAEVDWCGEWRQREDS
jgi:hypothetical protein